MSSQELLPLTEPWIEAYRTRVEPGLTPSNRAALASVWRWCAEYWGDPTDRERGKRWAHLIAEAASPLFENLESAQDEAAQAAAIREIVEFLDSIPPERLE